MCVCVCHCNVVFHRFKNRAEFLAALQTNKTFGFKGGLDVAVQAFRDKLQAHSEVSMEHERIWLCRHSPQGARHAAICSRA